MKYSIAEFAQEIRKQYPGDYDDLNDEKLVTLWLKKYPNDKEKITSENSSLNNSLNLKFCPNCGNRIELQSKFCSSCGSVIPNIVLQKPIVTTHSTVSQQNLDINQSLPVSKSSNNWDYKLLGIVGALFLIISPFLPLYMGASFMQMVSLANYLQLGGSLLDSNSYQTSQIPQWIAYVPIGFGIAVVISTFSNKWESITSLIIGLITIGLVIILQKGYNILEVGQYGIWAFLFGGAFTTWVSIIRLTRK